MELGIESQRRFCKFFVGLSHSRFNRRAHQLLPLIYLIRHILNQEVDLSGRILIIDSFPDQFVSQFAIIALKSFVVQLTLAIRQPKKKETTELMANAHPANHYLLGDEGYLGKDLAFKLNQMGYKLWTPYRKNMQGAKEHNDYQLMAIRRTIESNFSLLSYYNAENNRARSLTGFQERLEVAVLAYNMAYCLERFN